ncbi:MAG TPA: hypothetical protein VGX28_14065 [Frankiaceae bacterium]|jgi:hypothetical protein|nr:hypothetical protein [Frankiaceae bacterium]
MSDEAAPAKKSRFLPAVVTFVVVAAAVYLTGALATWVLKKVVLPLLAVLLGWIAARVVYRIRD